MTLDPLRCTHCGAAVPLLRGEPFACPYCRGRVHVPPPYHALFVAHAQEAEARHALEQRYTRVARPPRRRLDQAAVGLVLVAPPVLAALWVVVARVPPSAVGVFAGAIVPALLPGLALGIWSAAVHATLVRFELALAALPPEDDGGPPRCRICGAPLALAAGAISARCAYCGSDSLIGHVAEATRVLANKLRDELRTLGHAIAALRIRRRLLVGGAAAAAVLLAALVLVVLASYTRR